MRLVLENQAGRNGFVILMVGVLEVLRIVQRKDYLRVAIKGRLGTRYRRYARIVALMTVVIRVEELTHLSKGIKNVIFIELLKNTPQKLILLLLYKLLRHDRT